MFKKIFAIFLASITMVSSYAQAEDCELLVAKDKKSWHRGPRGHRGYHGHHGHHGKKGARGPQGPQGQPGQNGTSAPIDYLSVFTKFNAENSDPQSVVPPGGAVPFDQTKTQFGSSIATYTGTGVVTFNSSGTFEVTYGVSGFANSGSVIVALQLDSSLVNGSELNTTTGGFARMIGLSIIFTINAGQTLQLINTDPTNDFNLDAFPNGPPSPVTGYMVIKQLN